ncbi:MAG: fatty acid desaturase [Planctomycetaceae bacterium]
MVKTRSVQNSNTLHKNRQPVSHPLTPVNSSQRAAILESFSPDRLSWANADWTVVLWVLGLHAGCLLAPVFVTWQALLVAALLHWLAGSIGVCLGYHRYLSHCAFKLTRPVEFFVLLCGVISGQGSPLTWAATHRVHHNRSDQRGDPHSPLHGRVWSHILWLFVRRSKQQHEALLRRYVPELVNDRLLRFFEKTYGGWLVLTGLVLFAAGGLPMLIWGLCVRMTLSYHGTWFVNSATHLWGYQTYETGDQSRNLWWVAILAYGEGWHNNHHAYPRMAPAGHLWWEFDATWWIIRVLRFCRLATEVRDAKITRH